MRLVYRQVLRTAGSLHLLFFIVVIFMNSYYLLNLILAIVAMSYDQLERRAADERAAEEAAIADPDRMEVSQRVHTAHMKHSNDLFLHKFDWTIELADSSDLIPREA